MAGIAAGHGVACGDSSVLVNVNSTSNKKKSQNRDNGGNNGKKKKKVLDNFRLDAKFLSGFRANPGQHGVVQPQAWKVYASLGGGRPDDDGDISEAD